ncbi:hypothetical protein C8Q76DRAFT_764828 [Earliella scabrosa]|nr:hypothetical protein C8Q76DRAFT_764828 [Earliella scabrosa]
MPVQLFLDTFLPCHPNRSTTHMLASDNAFKWVPTEAKSPSGICAPLIVALNKSLLDECRCPGFVFEDTATRSLKPRRSGWTNPHICCFGEDNLKRVRTTDKASRAELGYAEQAVLTTFYRDPPPDVDTEDRTWHNLAEVYTYVADVPKAEQKANRALVFSRQFLAGSHARLLRWDRSGCVVSESFDLHEHPELLCDFLWRFSQTSDAGRGHDITEEAMFHTLITAETRFQLGVEGTELANAVARHYQPGKAIAVEILVREDEHEDPHLRRFIVSRPVVDPVWLDGRGTRGFWAVDPSRDRVAFLKDTWILGSSTELEGDTIRSLNLAGVCNVPRLVCHGEVLVNFDPSQRGSIQDTRTNEFSFHRWVCRMGGKTVHVSHRKHYRMVLDIVGYDLRSMRGTEELLHAGYDVLVAMRDALAKGSRLHRDISVGNIILVAERDRTIRRGYLVDWETSSKVDDTGMAYHVGRTGTWLFMSVNMLTGRAVTSGRHTIKDDMESLLYVILYCALLCLPHSLSIDDLSLVVSRIFEFSTTLNGTKVGGDGKMANAFTRRYTRSVVFKNSAIKKWLDAVMDFHTRVEIDDDDSQDEEDLAKWDPALLDGFWSDFLKHHTLERADRVSNEVHTFSRPRAKSSSMQSSVRTDLDEASSGSRPSALSQGEAR